MYIQHIMNRIEEIAQKPKVLLMAGFIGISLVFIQGWYSLFSSDLVVDTYVYYFGAEAMRRGLDLYDAQVISHLGKEAGLDDVYLYWHSPFTAAAFAPLLTFPPRIVHRMLMFFNAAAFALCLFLIFKILKPQRHKNALFFFFLLFMAVNGPAVTTMRIGQMNFIVLALVLACLMWHLEGKDALSALMLMLAIQIKVTPGILLLYILMFSSRRWQYLGWLGLWAFATILVSLPFAPLHYWLAYIPYALQGPQIQWPHSIWGWMVTNECFYPYLKDTKVLIYLVIALPLTIVSLVSIRKTNISERPVYAFAILILLSLLVSPLTWHHHFLFCTFPVFYFLTLHWRQQEKWRFAIFVAIALITLLRVPGDFLQYRPIGTAIALLVEILPRTFLPLRNLAPHSA